MTGKIAGRKHILNTLHVHYGDRIAANGITQKSMTLPTLRPVVHAKSRCMGFCKPSTDSKRRPPLYEEGPWVKWLCIAWSWRGRAASVHGHGPRRTRTRSRRNAPL